MCVFKNHAFIYFLRPPSWSGTSTVLYNPTLSASWNTQHFEPGVIGVRVTTYLDERKIIFAIRGPSFVDDAFCIREKVRNRRLPQFTEYRGGVGKSIQKSCYYHMSRILLQKLNSFPSMAGDCAPQSVNFVDSRRWMWILDRTQGDMSSSWNPAKCVI